MHEDTTRTVYEFGLDYLLVVYSLPTNVHVWFTYRAGSLELVEHNSGTDRELGKRIIALSETKVVSTAPVGHVPPITTGIWDNECRP